MKGKLIVFESGTDSSGKETQTRMLYDRLKNEGRKVHRVEFPDYKSKSSSLIKMYLKGEFGEEAEDVNPYATSTFFAVDRYASYQREWGKLYENGDIIIADRYTTSNMVHQGVKFKDIDKRDQFLNWLRDLEFNKYRLPVPDVVLFLDVPPAVSRELLKNRKVKSTAKDIHEENPEYLSNSYHNACMIAEKYNWLRINCVKNNKLKRAEEIHDEIYSELVLSDILK